MGGDASPSLQEFNERGLVAQQKFSTNLIRSDVAAHLLGMPRSFREPAM
ncbi:hypothetical protein BTK96_002964 [Burkholderia pyrrocinia]|nr:hypothetical protein [Burkholderia pyrrocinia]EKS9886008.1 hypothetical protein [Burkholderia pyrrocinia]EKS9892367.1 hypothetical protein [Burkholderia pyrrocinia]